MTRIRGNRSLLAAEVLVIGVLQPARAQDLVGQIVHVLEDQEPGHQPGRQRRLLRTDAANRAETLVEKVPVDLPPQPRQRMTQVDELLVAMSALATAGILIKVWQWSRRGRFRFVGVLAGSGGLCSLGGFFPPQGSALPEPRLYDQLDIRPIWFDLIRVCLLPNC